MKRNLLFTALLLGLGLTITVWGLIAPSELAYAGLAAAEDAGYYVVSVWAADAWQTVGALAYDKYITVQEIDLSHVALEGPVQVRVEHRGNTAAHIDALHLDGQPPYQVTGTAGPRDLALRKLAARDYDVIAATRRTLTFVFTGESANMLSLAARIEPEHISTLPFQFPLSNLYLPMRPESDFYRYIWDSQPGHLTIDGDLSGEALGTPFFKAFSRTGSGHPSDYTYGWVRNDADTLYVALDFVPDNTMDGDKDYAKVYVNTPGGLREFRASVPEQTWGRPGFVYTPRAVYQHKVYEFAIPLSALDIDTIAVGDVLPLAFAAYGTAAAPSEFPGALDLDFGTDGVVTTTFGSSSERAYDVALQSDGDIVVVGESNSRLAMARYTVTGTLDTAFGSGGTGKVTETASGISRGNSLVLQTGGRS